MTYQLPNLSFDRTKVISLSNAFDQVGWRMIPKDLVGKELFTHKSADPDELFAEKEAAEVAF